jgi:hypothetical protein
MSRLAVVVFSLAIVLMLFARRCWVSLTTAKTETPDEFEGRQW